MVDGGIILIKRLRDFTSQSGISGIGCSYQLEKQENIVIPWGLTIRFLKHLAVGLWLFSPLLLTLMLVIMLLGYLAGKQEGWSRFDSFYWAFVTATTVGYGDFRPTKRRSKLIAILTAVLGLLTMGIIIALGVHAATKAFDRT
ncbi:potassium channel family protein [Tunturiibacter gelidoferens]|uniref:Potassium channel family protein n=1 Tax=Tunturiibacter gelidiferens TaxID=3069689 RepID=A0AAU7YWM4_9BACT